MGIGNCNLIVFNIIFTPVAIGAEVNLRQQCTSALHVKSNRSIGARRMLDV